MGTNFAARAIYSRSGLGVTRVTPTDLLLTPDFILLGLDWSWFIVKFIVKQIYFVLKYFFNYSSNTKIYLKKLF